MSDPKPPLTRGDVMQLMHEAGTRAAANASIIAQQEAVHNQRVAAMSEILAESTRAPREKRDAAVDELKRLLELLQSDFGETGKEWLLRSGKISLRDSTTTEVADTASLMRLMRSLRLVRRVFDPQPPKLNKVKLKKLLGTNVKLAEKLKGAAWLQTHTRMTFTPNEVQIALERELKPLRRELSGP